MDVVYFTITAIVLYVAADYILDRVERAIGRRLQYRSVIFFFLLAGMATAAFAVLDKYLPG